MSILNILMLLALELLIFDVPFMHIDG